MLLSAGALGAVAVLDAGVGCPVTTGTAAGGMGTGVGANGDWTLGVDDEKRRPNGSGMLSYVTLCTRHRETTLFSLTRYTPKHDLELAIVSSALFFVYGRRTLRTLQIVDTGAILAP